MLTVGILCIYCSPASEAMYIKNMILSIFSEITVLLGEYSRRNNNSGIGFDKIIPIINIYGGYHLMVNHPLPHN